MSAAGCGRNANRKAISRFSNSTTAARSPTFRSSSMPIVPDYQSLIKQITTGSQRRHRRRTRRFAGSRASGSKSGRKSLKLLGTADPATYPLQKKGPQFRVPPRDGPSPAADEHVRRHGSCPKRPLLRHPPLLPGPRLSVRQHAHHHHQRLRRRRPDVSGDDAGSREARDESRVKSRKSEPAKAKTLLRLSTLDSDS